MKILTNENKVFDTDTLTGTISNLNYCILDVSTPKDIDFFFVPMVFLESFNSAAVVLKIAEFEISVPIDWYLMVGESEVNDLEMIPVRDINVRGFTTPIMNPLDGFMPRYEKVELIDSYNEVRWNFPKLGLNNILVVPLEYKMKPKCAFFVNEIVGKKMDRIDCSVIYN